MTNLNIPAANLNDNQLAIIETIAARPGVSIAELYAEHGWRYASQRFFYQAVARLRRKRGLLREERDGVKVRLYVA